LWTKVKQTRKRPARRLLMLLLALGAGLSVALALTRPEIPAIGAAAQRWMLILDNSASMAARTHDGRTRWQHAIERARALLEQAGAGTEVMLVDTTGRLRPSGFTDRDAASAALDRVPEAQWGSVGARTPAPGPGASVHRWSSAYRGARRGERALGVRAGGQFRGDGVRGTTADPGSDPL
jgi:hypothetical protein